MEVWKDNFLVSDDKSKLDLQVIHNFLSKDSYWAFGVPFEIVRKSIKNSLCFGIYEGKKQIGFARVVSDFTTFAYLCDVFVLEEFRGKGLSKFLIETLLKHENLQGLRSFQLATKDAHELYRKFEFETIAFPERFMKRPNKSNYGMTP